MAMPCSSSDRPRRATRAARWLGLSLLALGALGACTRQVSVTYLPSPDQPRLSLAEARGMLEGFASAECPRLAEGGRSEGAVRVLLVLGGDGAAASAELEGSTGDARMDGVIGAIGAQLQLAPPSSTPGAATLRAGFRCASDGRAAIVLDPL